MMFIKENIINQLINLEDRGKPYRHHKKSLSDCGDVMMFGYGGEENNQFFYDYPETAHSQTDPHQMGIMGFENEYFYHGNYGVQ